MALYASQAKPHGVHAGEMLRVMGGIWDRADAGVFCRAIITAAGIILLAGSSRRIVTPTTIPTPMVYPPVFVLVKKMEGKKKKKTQEEPSNFSPHFQAVNGYPE